MSYMLFEYKIRQLYRRGAELDQSGQVGLKLALSILTSFCLF